MTKLGPAIDVSEAQGSVDWAEVAQSGIKVGIAKVTEGKTYEDPMWGEARRKAMRQHVRPAVYHFAHPENNSPREEVEHFLYNVAKAGADLINYRDWRAGKGGFFAFLDFETPPFDPAWARGFGSLYQKQTGHRCGLYGYGASLNPILTELDHFTGVWIAAYAPDWKPYLKGGHKRVHFWQYTDKGSVPGVNGDVDRSHYLGG